MSPRQILDGGWRAGMRLGYWAMRLWWRVVRPDHEGVLVAIWHKGRVLLVRQSYRQVWTFPGGGMHAGETPRATACREMAEEIGLRVEPDNLTLVHDSVQTYESRRDRVRIFHLALAAEPVLALDNREIIAACFTEPAAALREAVTPHIRAYLASCR